MTIIAKNVGRIDVWPSTTNARDADTAESKLLQKMTIWPTRAAARANLSLSLGGGAGGTVTITSNGGGPTASISVEENQTAVTTVVATQAEPSGAITYSISGGADAALFEIDEDTGVLTFIDAPVYNTAPHDITFEWIGQDEAEGHNASYTEEYFSGNDPETTSSIAMLSATDDEGNPLVWSLTDDLDGKFVIDSGTDALKIAFAFTAEDSPYSGTVRATDTGGLYVEQEFTITVTT